MLSVDDACFSCSANRRMQPSSELRAAERFMFSHFHPPKEKGKKKTKREEEGRKRPEAHLHRHDGPTR